MLVWWFSWKKKFDVWVSTCSAQKGHRPKETVSLGTRMTAKVTEKSIRSRSIGIFREWQLTCVRKKLNRVAEVVNCIFYGEALKSTGFGKYWLYSKNDTYSLTYLPLSVPLRSLHTSFLFGASVFYHAIFNVMIYVFDKNWELMSIK